MNGGNSKLVNDLKGWMSKRGVKDMSDENADFWRTMKIELKKLGKLDKNRCTDCVDIVPRLVKNFCIDIQSSGVDPETVHALFHFFYQDSGRTRNVLNANNHMWKEDFQQLTYGMNWMSKDGVKAMGNENTNFWINMIIALSKLDTSFKKNCNEFCVDTVPRLVKTFCMDEPSSGVDPETVHSLFHILDQDYERTRNVLTDNTQTLGPMGNNTFSEFTFDKYSILTRYMTKEGIVRMGWDKIIDWDALKRELTKLPEKFPGDCKDHVAELVYEFCDSETEYGVNPMLVFYLFCFYENDISKTRARIIEEQETLEELRTSHNNLNDNKTRLAELEKKLKDTNVYVWKDFEEKEYLRLAIAFLKNQIERLVSKKNEEYSNPEKFPKGFYPILDLHYLMKDQVIPFVTKYLNMYPLGEKHEGMLFITGQGKNSSDNVPVIQQELMAHFAGTIHPDNRGLLYLTSYDILTIFMISFVCLKYTTKVQKSIS